MRTEVHFRLIVATLALGGLTACGDGSLFDIDLRGAAGAFDTSEAAQTATLQQPEPDARGVLSYPTYQVALARRGDTVADVAGRVGIPADELARHNAVPVNVPLRDGELLALPRRVSEPAGSVDVAALAGSAIDRAEARPGLPVGDEPERHRVSQGETAFSIARRYDVPVAALSEWNGLGPDLEVRVGQYLLIPPRASAPQEVEVAALPGAGTVTPVPPSAAEPLPEVDAAPAPELEAAPLEDTQTAASDTSRLRMPVSGNIVQAYAKGRNDGIAISAAAGTSVVAADDGTVAAITKDTDGVPIIVVKHAGNLLTVYARLGEITVEKGQTVSRGQKIGEVRSGSPSSLHFEVREGFESVDPVPYLG